MKTSAISRSRKGARPLYRAAKISDNRFRKVLWAFVRDVTVNEAAKETGLSANSVSAIFQKLRVYFLEVGLFTDYFEIIGADKNPELMDEAAIHILAFHSERVRSKRGLRENALAPRYHFAESHWRFHFEFIKTQRSSSDIHTMMYSNLEELIGICGPVGSKPMNRKAGLIAIMYQMDRRLVWLERNAPRYKSKADRATLAEIRGIRPNNL